MNGTLPEGGPLSSKSCLTVSRDELRTLIVIELMVRPFGKTLTAMNRQLLCLNSTLRSLRTLVTVEDFFVLKTRERTSFRTKKAPIRAA